MGHLPSAGRVPNAVSVIAAADSIILGEKILRFALWDLENLLLILVAVDCLVMWVYANLGAGVTRRFVLPGPHNRLRHLRAVIL